MRNCLVIQAAELIMLEGFRVGSQVPEVVETFQVFFGFSSELNISLIFAPLSWLSLSLRRIRERARSFKIRMIPATMHRMLIRSAM